METIFEFRVKDSFTGLNLSRRGELMETLGLNQKREFNPVSTSLAEVN